MPALNVPMINFNGGEIGGEAISRVDLEVYPTCCEVMENILPLMQGAMIKAPGTEYIGRSYLDHAAILRPFVYSVDQALVLEFTEGRIDIVSDNAYIDVVGTAASVGTPADNGSTGGSSVSVSGLEVTFEGAGNGEAAAYWPITGTAGLEVSFRFEIERRPLNIRVGTTSSSADIELPGPDDTFELTLDPGVHIISFTPTTTTYYIRARLREPGTAVMKSLTALGAYPSGDSGFFVPTPYQTVDLPQLRFRQSLDTYWLYHPRYQTRVLERRGNTSWSLRLFSPRDGPYEVPNSTDVTLTPDALSGDATVTASSPLFTADSVGQLIEITHQGQTESDTFTAAPQETGTIRVTGVSGSPASTTGGKITPAVTSSRQFSVEIAGAFTGALELQRSVDESDWTMVEIYTAPTSTTIDDGLDNQIIFYRVACTGLSAGTPTATLIYAGGDTTGRAVITSYTSPTEVEVEIYEPFGKTEASTEWSLGAWSAAQGWPVAGAIDDGRHCLVRDDRFWASVSDDYESFLIGTDADEAIARRYGTGEMNSARWIESGRRLLVGTNGAEIEITSNSLDEAITPLNNRLRGFDNNGSADTQAMKSGANRVLFVDRTRTKLFQCMLDETSADQHQTDDLTRLHEDIAGLITQEEAEAGDGGFVEIAVQRRPEPRVYCIRSDGEMAVLLFGPREGVYSWARLKAAETVAGEGLFKSVCVIPGAPEDRVHVSVERVIDGETRRHHERFSLQKFAIEEDEDGVRSAPDAWRLQAALYSNDDEHADDVIGGLGHLEGETVSIWADGRVHPPRVVTDGSITLEQPFNTLIIGLNYIGRWKSVKMAYGAQMGTALSMDKHVGRIGLSLRDTPLAAFGYGRTFEEALSRNQEHSGGDEPHDVTSDDEGDFTMDAPVELVSGDFSQPFEGATDIDARVCIVMDTPMPVKILGLVPNVELHEHA
jgi:hypothetical protein